MKDHHQLFSCAVYVVPTHLAMEDFGKYLGAVQRLGYIRNLPGWTTVYDAH